MKKSIILNLIFCCLALPVAAGQQISGKITVNGASRSYIGYLPTKLGESRPMLISCHGMNQDAPYQKNMLAIESVADTAKFLTIFPQGEGNSWDISGNKDIKFMEVLIDEMVKKYNIDRNCVYLSGFSMGGMFTYHAMNKIPDKIAAFAPISGYPMGGTTAGSKVRPLPIIHTHGTSDDVVGFSGVQGALNVWIKHNGCPTTAKVVKKYRNAAHITRHIWGPGKEGVEVVLMEMANKGHWISNDNGVKTGDEIWRFCKRFSLNKTEPTVLFTSPQGDQTIISLGGSVDAVPITLTADAYDNDGQVVSVAFYDGTTLLAEVAQAPYTCRIESLAKGTHQISAVATDNEGNTAKAQMTITAVEPTASYQLHTSFKTEGSVPEGWTTYDGAESRVGYSDGYTLGSRVFQFTNSTRDFRWGLYTRNTTGGKKEGYARFGDKLSTSTLMLHPGNYQFNYKACNWNQPDFSPITVAIETADGKEIFSQEYTPTANVGNAANKAFSGSKTQSFTFEVKEAGRYAITFYTADASWADLVVGEAAIRFTGEGTSIPTPPSTINTPSSTLLQYYTLSGHPVETPASGIFIEKRTEADGTTVSRKVVR